MSYHVLRLASRVQTVLFLVYLLLVGILFFNIYAGWQIRQKLPVFVRNFPQLTFQQGTLISPEQAVSITLPGTEYVLRLQAKASSVPTLQQFKEEKILAFLSGNQLYMPALSGVQSQQIPAKLDGPVTAQTLQDYLPQIRSLLYAAAFIGSLFVLAMFFLFSYILAFSVVFFWRGITRAVLPLAIVWKWAAFLQGPALVLWMINLCIGVPLFVFALFILFNIYTQQIFNILPKDRGNHAA